MVVSFLAPTLDSRAGGITSVIEALSAALSEKDGTQVLASAPARWSVWDSLLGESKREVVQQALNAGAQVVHTHGMWLAHAAAGAELRKNHALPEIISPHGMLDPWAVAHQRWKKRLVWWSGERAHLARASAIHALCGPEADAIRRQGIRTPIAMIPNGVDLPKEEVALPAPWEGVFPPHAKVLLFLGRLHPKKGVLPLIEAWAQLRGQLGEWRLALLGWDEGGHGRECEQAIERLGILNTCRWFGPAFGPVKAAAYANASAFVLPSFSEGLPMTVLEAWANRLPVFMTPACNLPEGFAARAAVKIATEPNLLAEQLRGGLLAHDAGTRLTAMGAAGRALVEQRFTWDQIAAEFIELYRWAIDGGPAPSCLVD